MTLSSKFCESSEVKASMISEGDGPDGPAASGSAWPLSGDVLAPDWARSPCAAACRRRRAAHSAEYLFELSWSRLERRPARKLWLLSDDSGSV